MGLELGAPKEHERQPLIYIIQILEPNPSPNGVFGPKISIVWAYFS